MVHSNMADTSQKDLNKWAPGADYSYYIGADAKNTASYNPATNSVTNSYNVVAFPDELGSDRYPYYIMFFVNANSKSELAQGAQLSDSKAAAAQATATANTPGQSVTGAINATSISQNAGGIAAGYKDWASTASGISKTVAEGLANVIGKFTKSTYRLSDAIALPIPNQVSFGSQADYQLIGSGMIGTLMRDAAKGDVAGALKDFATTMAQSAPAMLVGMASKGISETTGVNLFGGTGEQFKQLTMKLGGIAMNERKEQVFKQMDVRKFHFTWLLIPKNEKEAITIRDMVTWFKFNQYPEIDNTNNGLNLIIPNEFDLEFHYLEKEVDGIPKIATCVLEAVHTEYAPLGKWAAYDPKDPNNPSITGAPVATQLTLSFAEVEPLVRSLVAKGY